MRSFRAGATGLLCVVLTSAAAIGQAPPALDDWKADLAAFREKAPGLHKNLFHTMSQQAFNAMLKELDRDLPRLNANEVIVRLAAIVARIGDGHSYLDFTAPSVGFHQLPVQFYRFADGIFVVAADAPHASIVGWRLKTIGNYAAIDAFERVSTVVSADNDSQRLWLTPLFMGVPEILHGLGMVPETGVVSIVVEAGGQEQVVKLAALANRPATTSWNATAGWQQLPLSGRPTWLTRVSDPFWMEALPAARTVYVQINGVYPKPNESLEAFFDGAIRAAEKADVDKLVLDLRLNTGGNTGFLLPLVHRLIRSEKFSRRGSLFVLIGRQTFSAAQNFVDYLEVHTPAIFVGEPTAGRPNHYGDPEVFVLPRTGIPIRMATAWWQIAGPTDTRPWTAPEIFIDLASGDLAAGRDPALDAALAWRADTTLGARVVAAVRSGRSAEAPRIIDQFQSDPRSKFASAQTELYRAAADCASTGDVATAVLVLDAVVATFPDDSGAHGELAEMYLRAGNVGRAIAEFERAVTLDANNGHARIMLSRLKR